MKKEDFKPHTRYTITWRDAGGKLRPANIYVYRLYNDFMITRMTDKTGFLYKMPYSDVIKVVKVTPVPRETQFYVPDAVLAENSWKDRTVMHHYSSSPALGK